MCALKKGFIPREAPTKTLTNTIQKSLLLSLSGETSQPDGNGDEENTSLNIYFIYFLSLKLKLNNFCMRTFHRRKLMYGGWCLSKRNKLFTKVCEAFACVLCDKFHHVDLKYACFDIPDEKSMMPFIPPGLLNEMICFDYLSWTNAKENMSSNYILMHLLDDFPKGLNVKQFSWFSNRWFEFISPIMKGLKWSTLTIYFALVETSCIRVSGLKPPYIRPKLVGVSLKC